MRRSRVKHPGRGEGGGEARMATRSRRRVEAAPQCREVTFPTRARALEHHEIMRASVTTVLFNQRDPRPDPMRMPEYLPLHTLVARASYAAAPPATMRDAMRTGVLVVAIARANAEIPPPTALFCAALDDTTLGRVTCPALVHANVARHLVALGWADAPSAAAAIRHSLLLRPLRPLQCAPSSLSSSASSSVPPPPFDTFSVDLERPPELPTLFRLRDRRPKRVRPTVVPSRGLQTERYVLRRLLDVGGECDTMQVHVDPGNSNDGSIGSVSVPDTHAPPPADNDNDANPHLAADSGSGSVSSLSIDPSDSLRTSDAGGGSDSLLAALTPHSDPGRYKMDYFVPFSTLQPLFVSATTDVRY